MAWRDDLHAAQARIRALEEENASLRHELERARRAATPVPMPERAAHRPPAPLWNEPWVAGLAVAPGKLAYTDALGPARLRIVPLDGGPVSELVLAEGGHQTANRAGDRIVVELEDGSLGTVAWPSGELEATLRLGAAMSVPPLVRGGELWCATRDQKLHRVDLARFQVLESRRSEGGQELKRLGFEAARGTSLELQIAARRASKKLDAALAKLDWEVRRAASVPGGIVLSLSRSFGSDYQWGLARSDEPGATLRWVHEIGAGSPGRLSLVDGWLVAHNVRTSESSVVCALDTGRVWLRIRGVWEDARATTLAEDGSSLRSVPL
ncbi:MAG: hypothetical protein IT373_01855 [Polyangiaceae bacterium]|nr:hypothetical protein [Polyangiaceae bacterium]